MTSKTRWTRQKVLLFNQTATRTHQQQSDTNKEPITASSKVHLSHPPSAKLRPSLVSSPSSEVCRSIEPSEDPVLCEVILVWPHILSRVCCSSVCNVFTVSAQTGARTQGPLCIKGIKSNTSQPYTLDKADWMILLTAMITPRSVPWIHKTLSLQSVDYSRLSVA